MEWHPFPIYKRQLNHLKKFLRQIFVKCSLIFATPHSRHINKNFNTPHIHSLTINPTNNPDEIYAILLNALCAHKCYVWWQIVLCLNLYVNPLRQYRDDMRYNLTWINLPCKLFNVTSNGAKWFGLICNSNFSYKV